MDGQPCHEAEGVRIHILLSVFVETLQKTLLRGQGHTPDETPGSTDNKSSAQAGLYCGTGVYGTVGGRRAIEGIDEVSLRGEPSVSPTSLRSVESASLV